MGEVLDHQVAFMISHFANAHIAAATKYAGIPYCKAITDFLRAKAKISLAELGSADRAELQTHLQHIVEVLEQESNQLLEGYRSPSTTALQAHELKRYDACMKAAVEREDHYP